MARWQTMPELLLLNMYLKSFNGKNFTSSPCSCLPHTLLSPVKVISNIQLSCWNYNLFPPILLTRDRDGTLLSSLQQPFVYWTLAFLSSISSWLEKHNVLSLFLETIFAACSLLFFSSPATSLRGSSQTNNIYLWGLLRADCKLQDSSHSLLVWYRLVLSFC